MPIKPAKLKVLASFVLCLALNNERSIGRCVRSESRFLRFPRRTQNVNEGKHWKTLVIITKCHRNGALKRANIFLINLITSRGRTLQKNLRTCRLHISFVETFSSGLPETLSVLINF